MQFISIAGKEYVINEGAANMGKKSIKENKTSIRFAARNVNIPGKRLARKWFTFLTTE